MCEVQGAASASQQRRSLQQYTARCHVQDICKALLASVQKPNPGSIYNVVDDDPAGRVTVMAYAAKLLQAQPASAIDNHSTSACDSGIDPIQAGSRAVVKSSQEHTQIGDETGPSDISQVSKGGRRAEKRVSNAKIKAELSLALEFPSYREGLSAIHAGNKRPFD